jgi:retron-type reverse transcriptase
VSYLDDKEKHWVYMKNISDIADKQYHKDKLAKAYSTIKEALVEGARFVEIEL